MHYSTLAASLLMATGTLAAPPTRRQEGNTADITFTSQVGPFVVASVNEPNPESRIGPADAANAIGPFDAVELKVSGGVVNKDFRCMALNDKGDPIIVTRGTNTDVTWSDGGRGPWAFREPSFVRDIICTQALTKLDITTGGLRVQLGSEGSAIGAQHDLVAGQPDSIKRDDPRTFNQVTLLVGEDVSKQDYRCSILDGNDNPITLTRGTNTDITFGDGGKGAWTFDQPAPVSQINCSPLFAARPQ